LTNEQAGRIEKKLGARMRKLGYEV
jgi:hypothetical protein